MSRPIAAIVSLLVLAAYAAGAPSAAVMNDWQDQYGRLEKLIAGDARKQAPAKPMNFHRLVKPVLEAKCTPCHQKEKAPPDMSYASLQKYAFYLVGGKPTSGHWLTIPLHGGSRSVPGKHGAYGSPLLKYLDTSHHGTDLTADERRRITMWLDCNSNELGDYENEKAQRAGQVVWPLFDVNRDNVLGVETLRPARAAR